MIKTNIDLAAAAELAAERKSIYVMGAFGAPMTDSNKARYIREQAYNQQPDRAARIQKATPDTFGFDCVCFIKGLLWGWEGNPNSVYGGADYAVGGVPDIDTETMIRVCSEVSDDFREVAIGELLHMPGHVGLYIGNGLAVEATPDWADGVQISAVGNIGPVDGYPTRTWVKHGKLPYVTYITEDKHQEPPTAPETEEFVYEVSVCVSDAEQAETARTALKELGLMPVVYKLHAIDEPLYTEEAEPAAVIGEGSTVTIQTGAADYAGTALWSGLWTTPNASYRVSELRGDRAVITDSNGVTVAAMRVSDLILV